jgi:predicted DCC family thiol-disulfide oxidoreductase YuxK
MTWKLYYDGECNLCHGSQLQVARWASKSGQDIETEILQSDEAQNKGYEGDEIYRAHKAWIKLMTVAPWYLRWVAPVAKLPLLSWFTKIGYQFIAKYRKKFFGKRVCQLPTRH